MKLIYCTEWVERKYQGGLQEVSIIKGKVYLREENDYVYLCKTEDIILLTCLHEEK